MKLKKRDTREIDVYEEKCYVVDGMQIYGGSFVRALGVALQVADRQNTKKIKETWPEYWDRYLEMGRE